MDDKKLLSQTEAAAIACRNATGKDFLETRRLVDEFRALATPENVLRLVGMVKGGLGLRWTEEVPKNDGFYWKSNKKDWCGEQVNPGEFGYGVVRIIEEDDGKLHVDYCGWDISDSLDKIANDCYWAGPIPQPQDAE